MITPKMIIILIVSGLCVGMLLGLYTVPSKDENWKIVDDVQGESSGWIDPKGNWWSVPFAEHKMFAQWMLFNEYKAYAGYAFYNHSDRATDVLVQRGWLLIHTDPTSGTSIQGDMNIEQYVTLTKSFSNRILFRGWTVKALWRESPNYKEES